MKIEDAIKRYESWAEDDRIDVLIRKEHRQMADWLKEHKADRPQGYWTKTDVATYRCSECGKIQIADDVNELNFCCCCGSRNKIRRTKGAGDEL